MINIKYEDKKIRYITSLKGFSILSIVIMHLFQSYFKVQNGLIFKILSLGGTGVHIFFLCSAIGLTASQYLKQDSYCEFITKRISKIYIPYIIVILISFLTFFIFNIDDRFTALLGHVFLFKMFSKEFITSFGGQFWYISTIIQIYIVFLPIYHLSFKLERKKFIFLGLLISLFWWVLVYIIGKYDERVWNSFFLQFIWEIFIGIEIAKYLIMNSVIRIRKKTLIIVGLFAIAIMGAMAMYSNKLRLFNDVPALIGYLSISLIFSSNKYLNKIFDFYGSISFELFLTHILVFEIIFYIFPKTNIYVNTIVSIFAFIVSTFIAILFKKIVNTFIYKRKF